MRAEALHHAPEGCRIEGARFARRRGARQAADVRGEPRIPGVVDGPAIEKRLQAAGNRSQLGGQPFGPLAARLRRRQVARAEARDTPEHTLGHGPPFEQRGETGAQPPLAQMRDEQRDAFVAARPRPADAQRVVERFLDQARHLGFVGHVEARVEVGLERELAQQREAERVDGADGDVVEAIAKLAPARLVLGGMRGGLARARARCAPASRPPPCA